jgi:tRNA(Ile)-lysidine synthase
LLARVRSTLRTRGLLGCARRVLVACSGGPDSQALLHVLWSLRDEHGCVLLAASVNHGLRAGAEHDVAVARSLADALGVPFFALQVQVPAGASRQAQARGARYQALLACAREHAAECVAVGHTQDDQAETVLARLLRGTSVEGLSAIAPARADGVVRPLIDAPRDLVHAYVAQQQLAHVRDPSNDDPQYLRVRVRKQLLPRLAAENPQIGAQLAHLADDARAAAALLAAQADGLIARAALDLRVLLEAPEAARRRALKRWVERETSSSLRRQHVAALERMLSVGGEVRLPGGMLARLEAGRLTFALVLKRGRGVRRPNQEPEKGA